jgi:hypothetical protein
VFEDHGLDGTTVPRTSGARANRHVTSTDGFGPQDRAGRARGSHGGYLASGGPPGRTHVTGLHRRTRLGDLLARAYDLDWEDRFEGPELDRSRWLASYLPQWSSQTQAAARYAFGPGGLALRIDEDQQAWCPALDGSTRVSSLQTGVRSGPAGSTDGQHRFHPRAVVTETQEARRLYTPQFGVFVVRASVPDDRACMAALWMIGFEDRPEHSAEICVFEIFGRDVQPDRVAVGMGVHPFGDPMITDEFTQVPVAIDARRPHEYAAEWTPDHVRFFVDGDEVKVVDQSPQYPMQLMLGLYEFRDADAAGPYPKRCTVASVQAYRRRV